MKLLLDIENKTNQTSFQKGNILFYDGKEWYLTTKEDVFNELNEKLNNYINYFSEKNSELEKNFEEFKSKVSSQLLEMASLIKELYKK